MIEGLDLERDTTLLRLQESPYKFYLTGSRYFGNAQVYSDYDFFTADSRAVRLFLTNLGFQQLTLGQGNGYYQDDNCAAIFRREDVDVQCVKNVLIKKQAQLLLYVYNFHNNTPKISRRDLWNAAYDTVTEICNMIT